MVKKIIKQSIVVLASLFLCVIIFFGSAGANFINAFAAENSNYDTEKVLYLSDTSRITHNSSKSSSLGNTRLFMAPANLANIPGGAMQAKIEDAWYTFKYGIYAHGPSCVAFNISEFSQKYKYFSAYGGLLSSASKSNGVLLYVQTSEDGVNWTPNPAAKTLIKYNQNFNYFTMDVTGVKWIRLVAEHNGSNAQDYVVWADAKLSTSLDDGEAVKSLDVYDAQIKAKVANANLDDMQANLFADKELELLVLQRELVSRVGQYALKRFMTQSGDANEANKAVLDWLLNDLDSLREFMLGGTPFKGNYYNSLTVLSGLYKSYKNDLSDTTLLSGDGNPGSGNKFMPKRTFGELCRTMMFSVALTHDSTIGSYLQASVKANQSEANRRYAIFKYLYQTERFVATRNADGSWKSETMNMFGSLKVEEMRWLMCAIIDDESLIWLNDYVQTRINNAPNNVGNLYTPHSYVRYTDPNYNNPVFYDDANYDYFNALFSVDSREVKVSNNVIIEDDNVGTALAKDQISESAHKNANITHYGLWDAKYIVPAGEGEQPYTMSVSRKVDGVAKLQKVWMNFNNKFKTGSVCGGISKSGVNIRTSRGIPANVIGQPGHAAILYFSKDANGKGSWKIDNDVGGWLAATKGERHLLGWGNEAWQRNSGGTVVYFHLAQLCLDDYDNLVRAEEYCWLAKVYQGDVNKQEKLYEKALSTQILNLDAWYGLVTTYKANTAKTAVDYSTLATRIGDTLWNHPVAMHCLFRLFTDTEKTNVAAVQATLNDPLFTTQLKTIEVNALAKAKASGSTAAKSKVSYLLGNTDTAVASFSFDTGKIVWADSYNDGSFTWKYSLDGKKTWTEVTFNPGDSHAYQLNEKEISSISTDNDIYVYIVGASPDNAYRIDVGAKPAMPDTLYANDWENRIIGVDASYEWRYLKETDDEYTPASDWTAYSEASPDCSGDKAIEVRIKGTAQKPASDGRVFTFTADTDSEDRKYISVNYLTLVEFSTQSKDSKRPNYAVNAIDGNAKTYWHTDYTVSIKASMLDEKGQVIEENKPYLIIKLDVPRYISALEFVQNQYNTNFSIFAKKATVYVSETGEDGSWKKAGTREGFENIDDLKAVHFDESVYGQYVKLVMDELYETNANDGVFTTVSMINLYEDTTKNESPYGEEMPSLSEITPSGGSSSELGGTIDENQSPNQGGASDETEAPADSNAVLWIVLSIVFVILIAGGVAVFFVVRRKTATQKAIVKKYATKKIATQKPATQKPATQKPAATAAKPAPAATKPAATAAKPAPAAAKPAATAAKPAPAAAKPAATAAKPAPAAAKPAATAAKPAPAAQKPAATAAKPAPAAAKPAAPAAKPAPAAAKPAAPAAKPAPAAAKPAATAAKPAPAAAKPVAKPAATKPAAKPATKPATQKPTTPKGK